jgi:RNA polymerase sigma-70 factor (ECF subfamily)
MMEISLELLVAQARDGRREAVERLLAQEQQRIFAITFHMLSHRQEAEEAAQEALERIFTRLDQLRTPAHFRAWSAQLTANLCRDRLRRREPLREPIEEAHSLAGGPTPLQETCRNELHRQLHKALSSLTPVLRLAVLLRDVEGLSYEEVAAALEIPEGTVKSRLFEARRKLREHLSQIGVMNSHG